MGDAESRCRVCSAVLSHRFADLGVSPIANAYLTHDQLDAPETFYPLRVWVCEQCLLVQAEDFEAREHIFAGDYAYFSSYSSTWLEHCARYTAGVIERFGVGTQDLVVEVASNDGYLLRHFLERGIRVLGIEPAASVAQAAAIQGIPTVQRFFGKDLARELEAQGQANLLIANNVLAHVPDPNDFVAGLKILLAPAGVLTIEFPNLVRLIEEAQFDTIYHEHFSYLMMKTARDLLARHGLAVFDVDELPTHGGSLRIYARHAEEPDPAVGGDVDELEAGDRDRGYHSLDAYLHFQQRIEGTKLEILGSLVAARADGVRIAGYGAPAKGNTLLNYCGVGPELMEFTVDASPHKQGLYLPGTRIPIRDPEEIRRAKPDLVFILPWNIRDEIMEQLFYIREWGGQFLVRTPELRRLP